jgi:hypothetical protein
MDINRCKWVSGEPSLPPAPLAAAFCGISGIPGGDARVALVMTPRVLLAFFTGFKQPRRNILDAVAALRRHHAPDEIRMATTWTISIAHRRSTLEAQLIIRSGAFSSQAAVIAGSFGADHGGGGIMLASASYLT